MMDEIIQLEQKASDLVSRYDILQQRCIELVKERDQLHKEQRISREKINAIISRLQTLEETL